MSFMNYVQSLWSPAAPSAPASSSGFPSATSAVAARNSSGSAQQLGSGVWPLSPQMREEMKKGTRFNMKVILRGTKGTGKSTLLARLTCHPLPTFYTPSTEMVASTMRLQGEQCAPHEGTKVDIWEVVEEGRQRSSLSSSLNATSKAAQRVPSAQLQEALRVATDARLRDAYTGAHLTIFLIDPRQRTSWEYAKQETPHVPPTCCILYALNFADVATPSSSSSSAAAAAVPLAEVQAWSARTRRATTSVVHRLLEGRQASEEFSVLPMTAVCSALTGSGVMGVVRALHVASTLQRIATEEVRVLRLFELMRRQQAVVIDNDAAPQPSSSPPLLPTQGGATAATISVGGDSGVAEREAANTGDAGSAPVTETGEGTAPLSASTSASRSGGHPSSAVQQQQQPDQLAAAALASTALRTEHRTTLPSSSTIAALRDAHGRPGLPNGTAVQQGRLSEAEAMKLFLGGSSSGSNSNASDHSSRSSSSSSPASAAGHAVMNARRLPPVTRTNERPAEPLPPASSAERTVADTVGGATAGPTASLPSPPHDMTTGVQREATADTTAHAAPPPEAELVRSLAAAAMVHDAATPADDFFYEDAAGTAAEPHDATAAALVSAASVEPPAGAIRAASLADFPVLETVKEDGLRARPLWTQRVVRKAPAGPSAATGDRQPTLQVDVSAIAAEMAAALSAGVAAASEEAGDTQRDSGAAAPQFDPDLPAEQTVDEVAGEKTRKKKSPKHHGHSKERGAERNEHGRHKKHRVHRSTAEEQHENQAENAEDDDGSFELVIS